MIEQFDEDKSGKGKASDEQILCGQQSDASEYGEQGQQTTRDRSEDTSFDRGAESMSGQPMGGVTDSNRGEAATLKQRVDCASHGSSSADATGGSDFANQGRGALDEEEDGA